MTMESNIFLIRCNDLLGYLDQYNIRGVLKTPLSLNNFLKSQSSNVNVTCVDFTPSPFDLVGVNCDVFTVNRPTPFPSLLTAIKTIKDSVQAPRIIEGWLNDVVLVNNDCDILPTTKLILNDLDFAKLFNQTNRGNICFVPELNKWFVFSLINGWREAKAQDPLNFIVSLVHRLESNLNEFKNYDDGDCEQFKKAEKYIEGLKSSIKLNALKRIIKDINAIQLEQFLKSKLIRFIDGVMVNGHCRDAKAGDLFFAMDCIPMTIKPSVGSLNENKDYCNRIGLDQDSLKQLKEIFNSLFCYENSNLWIAKNAYGYLNQEFAIGFLNCLAPYTQTLNAALETVATKNVNRFFNTKLIILKNFSECDTVTNKVRATAKLLMGLDSINFNNGRSINLNSNLLIFEKISFNNAITVANKFDLPLERVNYIDFSFLNVKEIADFKKVIPVLLNNNTT